MLDWSFKDFECLPLLVTLLLDKGVTLSLRSLNKLYDDDIRKVSERLWDTEANRPFLETIFKSIAIGKFDTRETYVKDKVTRENFSELFLEPVSFFRWAESIGYRLPYPVQDNVEAKEDEISVYKFANYTISKSQVAEKLREPLWIIHHAIMYLHGFEPPEIRLTRHYCKLSWRIITRHERMNSIMQYLRDAESVGEIQLYPGSGPKDKVKPKEFMAWAKSLDMDFPNLIVPETDPPLSKPPKDQLHNKEKATLLKMIIGMAKDGYGYDPKASRSPLPKELEGILDRLGIPVSDDTIRKWLNEAAKDLPQDVDD